MMNQLSSIDWVNVKNSATELFIVLGGFGLCIISGVGATKLIREWNEEREAEKIRRRFLQRED